MNLPVPGSMPGTGAPPTRTCVEHVFFRPFTGGLLLRVRPGGGLPKTAAKIVLALSLRGERADGGLPGRGGERAGAVVAQWMSFIVARWRGVRTKPRHFCGFVKKST